MPLIYEASPWPCARSAIAVLGLRGYSRRLFNEIDLRWENRKYLEEPEMPKVKKLLSPAKLKERDVTKQVCDFLKLRGWRPVRFQRTVMPGQFQTGEPGIPDFLMLRYLENGVALAVWVEFKHPKTGKTRDDQVIWQERERLRGATVIQVNNLEVFGKWYDTHFGWVHTDDSLKGQKAMQFEEAMA
jgi:hypothetical protein